MKTLVCIILLAFLMSCFGKNPTIETGHEGKSLPSISLLLMDSSTHIDIKTEVKNKPTILFYFSPHCPYCRSMTKSILKDINKFDDINIYMLSSFPFNEIKGYCDEFKLRNYQAITVAQDYENIFSQYYKSPGVPCIAIYGRDAKLKEVIMGNVSTGFLKDVASE